MKVMLIFPPQWTPAMPHLALPALSSYLRANGATVILDATAAALVAWQYGRGVAVPVPCERDATCLWLPA